MIVEPNTEELREKVNDVYELIILISKRARELQSGSEKRTIFKHINPLTVASHEVAEGKVFNAEKQEEK